MIFSLFIHSCPSLTDSLPITALEMILVVIYSVKLQQIKQTKYQYQSGCCPYNSNALINANLTMKVAESNFNRFHKKGMTSNDLMEQWLDSALRCLCSLVEIPFEFSTFFDLSDCVYTAVNNHNRPPSNDERDFTKISQFSLIKDFSSTGVGRLGTKTAY